MLHSKKLLMFSPSPIPLVLHLLVSTPFLQGHPPDEGIPLVLHLMFGTPIPLGCPPPPPMMSILPSLAPLGQ